MLIFEKFQLSSQYTPQKLWSLYEDSVLTELEAYSPYKRSILKNAAVEFPDEEMANAFIPPAWLGEDVTNNREYHNSNLSKKSF